MEIYLEQHGSQEGGFLCVNFSVGYDFEHRQPH